MVFLAAIGDVGATQVDLDHDLRGNVLSRSRGSGWVSFGYDLGDRVVTVGENNTLQATHRYDGLGRRTKTTKANGDQRFQIYTQGGQFVWEGDFVSSQGVASGVNYVNLNGSLIAKLVADWSLPAQRDGDGRPTKLSGVFRNVFADAGATSIVAPADGSRPQRLADVPVTYHLRYVHTDVLGSPVVETNAIGEEITGTRTLYEPYGTPLTTPRDGAPSYTGHPYDTGTGLIYAQQRYYDPQLGVFYSPDPMAVDTTSAFNFNRYAYANNSPYKFTDPDGRESEFLEGFGAGAEASVTGNFRTDEMTSFSRGAGYLMGYGFAQRGQAGPAPPSGPSGMQARIFAASQRPMTASTASSSKVNGNSAASTTPQHRYEIRDRSGDVVKTGISGAPLNQNDSSRRANTQVNRLNRQEGDGAYSATVVETDIPGRTAALQSERAATNRLRAEGNTLRLQQRPQPEN